MKLYLGVDGGQSGTMALIGDETGRVIGVGRAGPCNHARKAEGRARFTQAVEGSVRGALAEAGIFAPLSEVRFAAACMGMSGGPADKDALAREIVNAEKYAIVHDTLIALAGATGGTGIVIIAGTGSIAFGRNAAGKTASAGGWGYAFGDEGSAFHLVRQALRASLRFEEGWGPATALHGGLLAATGAATADALLHDFYSDEYTRGRIAGLARIVDEAARAGDAIARDILLEGAQSLALFVAAVRGRIFEAGENARVSYIGGVFRSAILLERMRALVELEESNRVVAPKSSAAVGALMEAYRIAGIDCEVTGAPVEKIDAKLSES